MSAARGLAGLSAVVALVAALTACSGPSGTGEKSATATPTAMSNAGFGDAPSGEPVAVTEANFVSPSGNIGCHLDKSGARCDITRKSWPVPAPPEDCDLDWGAGISVHQKGKATFTCAGDTVLGGTEELPYGSALQAGDFVCTSATSQMRCENTVTKHGFALAVEEYNLF